MKISAFVKDIVLFGYRLLLLSSPVPVFRFNHASVRDEAEFVSAEIDSLLAASCIIESDACPIVCSPLLVVSNSRGEKRLVLDLRGVNQRFKYEGLNLVSDMCSHDE